MSFITTTLPAPRLRRVAVAPGVDMVMARLASSEIERVGGIWAGMSGSPVYAVDGRLIGAVSYGLTGGNSPVAGITPAADMQTLLDALPEEPAAAGLARTATADRVDIPRWPAGSSPRARRAAPGPRVVSSASPCRSASPGSPTTAG